MTEDNAVQNDNLKTFVGDNYDYYQQKWQLKPGQFTGFNFAAFFLGVVWLIYRKMYLFAVIFLTLIGLDMWIETYYPLPESVGTLVNIAIATTFGMLGNSLYKKHAAKTIQKIVNTSSSDNVQTDLTKAGGTNFAGACSFLIFILVLIAYAMYAIIKTSN